jgi:tRNA-Thr(GGU) m(6)t(6)A37 methyltransferase TsaA
MTESRANPVSPAQAGSVTPDPGVHEPPRRRRFSALYKAWIVDEANSARDPGAVGALLRREGLGSSHLAAWRRQHRAGALEALSRGSGRPPANPLAVENDRLRNRVARLVARLEQAERKSPATWTISLTAGRPAVASVTFRPIGVIRTPFTDVKGMPVQGAAVNGVEGWIDLAPVLVEGLRDLEGFSHLTLLYHLHRTSAARLTVVPSLEDQPHGVFATRSPVRPNPIGLSTVRLLVIKGTRLHVDGVDMVDGTPLLDIKPYVPAFDDRDHARSGWFSEHLDRLANARTDDRFR